MRKVLALILLLLSFAAQAQVNFFWRAEGTTLSGTDDHSGGDTTASANNTPTLDAGASKVGTLGMLFNGTSERYQFDAGTGIISPTLGSFGFWLRVDSWAANQVVLGVRGSTGGNNGFSVELLTLASGDLRFNIASSLGASTAITTAGADHVEDVWYFVVLRVNTAGNLARIETYTESAGTLTLFTSGEDTDGHTAPLDLTASDGLRFGDGSGSGGVFHIDNPMIGAAYAEPLQNYALFTSYTQIGGSSSGLLSRRRRN